MDLRDLPEHSQRAALRMAQRAHKRKAAEQTLEATQVQPLTSTPAIAGDPDRRAMFIADVAQRVMAKGSKHTADYLVRVYHFRRKVAYAVIREARKEMAAHMATQTDELRAVAEARLEWLMRRADKACDLTNYGRALKEWMRLHGLYRQDDTTLGDFAALMRTVTAEADSLKIKDAEFKVLTGQEEGETAEEPEWQEPAGYLPEPSEEDEDE